MSTLTQAQYIAAYLWFAGGPKRTHNILYGKRGIQEKLELSKHEIKGILRSPEYLVVVKHLMMTGRTPKRRKEWIDSWDGKLDRFAERMALSRDDAAGLFTEVRQRTVMDLSKAQPL